MEKKCKSAPLFHLSIDEELSPEQRGKLENHLKVCDLCRKKLDTLRRANSFLVELDEIDPSDSFSRSFWAKVDDYEEKRTFRSFISSIKNLWRPRFVVAVATLLVVGFVAFENNFYMVASEEMIMAVDLELLENFELVENLDLLENLDDIMEGPDAG